MASITEFKILTNSIDTNINIIQHISTGYYNITKINNIIYEEQLKENEARGIPRASKKEITKWFCNKGNKEYINFLKNQEEIKDLSYELKTGIDFKFHGTYVHELLYDQILMWIDKTYAYKVSKMLKEHRDKFNKKLENENIELKEEVNKKSCKIDELKDLINKQSEESKKIAKEQQEKIDELLNFAKNTNEKLDDANENINDLHEKVDEVNEYLNDVKVKLDDATEDRAPKPENLKFTNSFIIFKIGLIKFYVLKCQQKSINANIKKLKTKFNQCDEILRIGYSPNTINLFQRVKDNLKDNLKVKNAEITLVKMTEEELIRKINQINDNKKNVNIP